MKTLKSMTVPLEGKTREDVLRITRRVLAMSDVQSFAITPKGVQIGRLVEEEEEVFVDATNVVHLPALLEALDLQTISFDPSEHGTMTLYRACQKLEEIKLVPTWLVANSWPLLAAWLDVPKDLTPTMIFGLRVIITDAQILDDRFFLLGAEADNNFISDTKSAVTIDIGV